jgi:hypothetical protein
MAGEREGGLIARVASGISSISAADQDACARFRPSSPTFSSLL